MDGLFKRAANTAVLSLESRLVWGGLNIGTFLGSLFLGSLACFTWTIEEGLVDEIRRERPQRLQLA